MMKVKYRTLLLAATALVMISFPAWGEINVNLNIDIPVKTKPAPAPAPAPVVVVPVPAPAPPPAVDDDDAPEFIMPSSLGFYVSITGNTNLYMVDNTYYTFRNNRWYQGSYYRGPWVEIKSIQLPMTIRRHTHDDIVVVRDRECRYYREDHARYKGRYFRPERIRKEIRKEEIREEKRLEREDRRLEREERKEEREERKEERKEKKKHKKGHGHGHKKHHDDEDDD